MPESSKLGTQVPDVRKVWFCPQETEAETSVSRECLGHRIREVEVKIKVDEKELETFLLENHDHHGLWNEKHAVFSQLRLGDAGIADIVTFNRCRRGKFYDCAVSVYELKVEQLNVDAFVQVSRYLSYLGEYLADFYPQDDIFYNGVLIGPGPTINSNLYYILNSPIGEGLTILTYALDAKHGVSFSEFHSSHIKPDDLTENLYNQIHHRIHDVTGHDEEIKSKTPVETKGNEIIQDFLEENDGQAIH